MSVLIKIGNSRILSCHKSKLSSFKSSKSGIIECLRQIKGSKKILVASVVPKLSRFLKKKSANEIIREIHLNDIPIRSLYSKTLGIDRLLNVYGASFRTKKNIVIIDIGTAVSVDFFDAQRKLHLGGFILAGPQILAAALAKRTALLPEVQISNLHPRKLATTTRRALLQGQQLYLRGIVSEVRRISQKVFDSAFLIFVTGGLSHKLSFDKTRKSPHLIIEAMRKLDATRPR